MFVLSCSAAMITLVNALVLRLAADLCSRIEVRAALRRPACGSLVVCTQPSTSHTLHMFKDPQALFLMSSVEHQVGGH